MMETIALVIVVVWLLSWFDTTGWDMPERPKRQPRTTAQIISIAVVAILAAVSLYLIVG